MVKTKHKRVDCIRVSIVVIMMVGSGQFITTFSFFDNLNQNDVSELLPFHLKREDEILLSAKYTQKSQ